MELFFGEFCMCRALCVLSFVCVELWRRGVGVCVWSCGCLSGVVCVCVCIEGHSCSTGFTRLLFFALECMDHSANLFDMCMLACERSECNYQCAQCGIRSKDIRRQGVCEGS